MTSTTRQLVEIPHKQLMNDAWQSLSGKWGIAVPAALIYMVISGVAGLIPAVPLLIGGPFALGIAIFALKFARNEDPQISNIFDGFQNFGNALGTYILMMLAIIIGIILFIVPGIILAFGLSQTMFILAEEPKIGPVNALKKSWEMMKGYKMEYFMLSIRFIPWALLCVLTLFIGFLWLIPYMQVTFANFYDHINENERDDDEEDISKHLVDN